jgi:transposase
MKKEYINESAWIKIYLFLKGCKKVYIAGYKNFLEAVFWISRSGAQWRMLPEKYGNWNSIFKRFNTWSKKEVFDDLLAFCAQDPDLEYISIDATIVRAHACSAGYGKQEDEGLGRSKGGFTSKIHAKVDALGNPLKFIVTPGQTSDVTQANILLEGVTDAYVIGDKGYDSKMLREMIKQQRCEPVIPSRSNALFPYEYDKDIYKERHVIECYFSKMKHFRRVFSRFDKSARNFNSFLSFVGAIIWLR